MNTIIPNLDVTKLPGFLRQELRQAPIRGEGLHQWIFKIARQLHAHGSEEQIYALLAAVLSDSGVKNREIADAVRNSKPVAWCPSNSFQASSSSPPRWPKFNALLHSRVINGMEGIGTDELAGLSPRSNVRDLTDTEQIIDLLYKGNPLLCCGRHPSEFATKHREEWRGSLSDLQFIVPSPMAKASGTTQDGRLSARCLDNAGDRRFLVVEFDRGTKSEHAKILFYLASVAPLALVVDSGGKSLHGWFDCKMEGSVCLYAFFYLAVSLGADPATYSPCQMVRMPAGLRDNGNRQRVLFMAPEVIS